MSTTNTATYGKNCGRVLCEWEKERLDMAPSVAKHVLDPLMTFAELIRGYDEGKGINFTMEEISAVLRLLVLGGHMDVMMHCAQGGFLCHVTGEELKNYAQEFADMTRGEA